MIENDYNQLFDIMMKYYEKNVICFKHGISHVEKDSTWGDKDLLYKLVDSSWVNEKKLKMFFQAVDKSKVAPAKDMFEKTIRQCSLSQDKQKHMPLIQSNFDKWYPKEEN